MHGVPLASTHSIVAYIGVRYEKVSYISHLAKILHRKLSNTLTLTAQAAGAVGAGVEGAGVGGVAGAVVIGGGIRLVGAGVGGETGAGVAGVMGAGVGRATGAGVGVNVIEKL